MHKLLLSTLFLSGILCVAPGRQAHAAPAAASADTSGHAWSRVQALAPNTLLHIKARTHNAHCRLQSADPDSLTCLAVGKPLTFQRADILSIKVPHRTRSTVVGIAAGAGVGAIIGAAAGQNGQIIGRAGLAGIFAIPLGFIGGLIGAATDFTSSTIYHP